MKKIIIIILSLLLIIGCSSNKELKKDKSNLTNEEIKNEEIENGEEIKETTIPKQTIEENNNTNNVQNKPNNTSNNNSSNNSYQNNSDQQNNNSNNSNNQNTLPPIVTPTITDTPSIDKPTNNNAETKIISATKEYYCIDGQRLIGDKCVKTEYYDALKKYYCKDGTSGNATCTEETYTIITINPYSVEYETCKNQGYNDARAKNCVCSKKGGITIDGQCKKKSTTTYQANIEYYCTNGLTLNGNKCIANFDFPASYKYTCPSGYTVSGINCKKE